MFFDLITLNGYGLFIWSAFFFTISICLLLYLKTWNEFKKSEKIFLKEFGQFETSYVRVEEGIKNQKPVLYNTFYS